MRRTTSKKGGAGSGFKVLDVFAGVLPSSSSSSSSSSSASSSTANSAAAVPPIAAPVGGSLARGNASIIVGDAGGGAPGTPKRPSPASNAATNAAAVTAAVTATAPAGERAAASHTDVTGLTERVRTRALLDRPRGRLTGLRRRGLLRARQDIEEAVAGMSPEDAKHFRDKMAQLSLVLESELNQIAEQSNKLAVRPGARRDPGGRAHSAFRIDTGCWRARRSRSRSVVSSAPSLTGPA